MTVTYTRDVSNAEILAFLKTIFRWRGSLWKAIYVEFIIWTLSYTILSVIYRTCLNEDQQIIFEKVCLLAYKYGDFIPISFMLGFFVNIVVTRWQSRFDSIGWVDDLALVTAAYLEGADERSRMMRRNIARYLCLLQVLVFRTISKGIKKRFPTLDTLVAAGYLEPCERVDLTDTKFYVPIKWAMAIVRQARKEGRVASDHAVQDMYKHYCDIRGKLLSLWLADWVPVPLVYTQVVFISVRFYFILMILGRQYINVERNPSRGPMDAYVPFISMFQFMVFVGWMKVAEALLNPFGEDDDDFECNWVIDRNLQVAMAVVDQPTAMQPPLVVDKFWKEGDITPLYTPETLDRPQNSQFGSAATKRKRSESIIMVPRTSESSENILDFSSNGLPPNVIIDPNYRRPSLAGRALRALSSVTSLSRLTPVERRAPTPTPSITGIINQSFHDEETGTQTVVLNGSARQRRSSEPGVGEAYRSRLTSRCNQQHTLGSVEEVYESPDIQSDICVDDIRHFMEEPVPTNETKPAPTFVLNGEATDVNNKPLRGSTSHGTNILRRTYPRAQRRSRVQAKRKGLSSASLTNRKAARSDSTSSSGTAS